jgi:signal transduction histidine kinase
MKFIRSLRGRVVLGAVFWTLGLFTVTSLIIMEMLTQRPHTVVLVHRTLGHTAILSLVALGLLAVGLSQVSRGVSPIAQLRHRLSSVHQGRATRVDGDFPSEVQPLVNDLNGLLAHHESAIARAQTKAGDLAHGLKTPLAVLSQEAATAEAAGHAALAAAIRQQVDRMQRQIDWHLAHARAAASAATSTARASLNESVDGLIRTLTRIHADRSLNFRADIPDATAVQVQRPDLDEMLGNLLDNAAKWARGHVAISATTSDSRVVVVIDDDGPGIPEAKRTEVLKRGVRADETAPGFGFGLAIVRDLAEVYGGAIRLDRSPLGGTRAALTLPVRV